MKKLQQLVKEADRDTTSDEDDVATLTMKPKTGKEKKKKKKLQDDAMPRGSEQQDVTGAVPIAMSSQQTAPASANQPRPSQSSSDGKLKTVRAGEVMEKDLLNCAVKKAESRSDGGVKLSKKEGRPLQVRNDDDDDDQSNDKCGVNSGTTTQPKKSKQEAKQRRRVRELEDERLLNELASAEGSKAKSADNMEVHRDPDYDAALVASAAVLGVVCGSEAPTAAAWLETCDPDRLDPRKEKIRKLGISAVEGGRGNTQQQQRSNPYLPPNAKLPSFRLSPFATPDRHSWPPFTPLLALCVNPAARAAAASSGRKQADSGATMYYVDSSSHENVSADEEFDRQVRSMADVRTMVATCLHRSPYHLPTLLQLHTAFTVLGDVSQAQMMLDRAMYAVGVLLARFPLGQTSASRQLPYSDPRNQQVFLVLSRGMHSALKMGCAETAMGLAKLLLSLDPALDPKAALLCVDYCALRGKDWRSLVARWPTMAPRLPGFAFHGALAKLLMERQAAEDAEKQAGAGGKNIAKPIAGSRADHLVEVGGPTAFDMLVEAALLHPRAAAMLCEKAELKVASAVPMVSMAEAAASTGASDRVAKLFADRSYDLWKSKEVQRFATTAFTRACELSASASYSTCSFASKAELEAARDAIPHDALMRRYRDATSEDVLGETSNRIPAELLANFQRDDEEMAEALMLGGGGGEQHVMLAQYDADMFRRMRAAFGHVPGTYEEQLATYIDRLTIYEQRIGQDYNPLALFLRTLMPGAASIREMTIQRALHEAGVPDPVAAERRQQRQRDAVLGDGEQDAELDESSDEDDSSDED
jgi:hypothetical protein